MRVSTGESSRSWTSSVVADGPGEETLQKSELLRDRPRVGEMHGRSLGRARTIEASVPPRHSGQAAEAADAQCRVRVRAVGSGARCSLVVWSLHVGAFGFVHVGVSTYT